jgi:tRNA pseudouridine55 synthase
MSCYSNNGIILLDKPAGISSNLAIQKVKRYFKLKKIGHTGTLDPMATGLLPLCIGEATKFSSELLTSTKEYIAEVQLGLETDSKDITGKLLNQNSINQSIKISDIEKLIKTKFLGKILQTPPLFSALKHQGKPLYHYARVGDTSVQKPPREIIIYNVNIVHYDDKNHILTFKALVSKGTYIRVLADDISKEICGYGGCLTKLRRTKTSDFNIENAITLEEVLNTKDINLIMKPITDIFVNTPAYNLTEIEFNRISCGNHININTPSQQQKYEGKQKITLFFNQIFIGLASYADKKISATRLISNESLIEQNLK